MIVYRVPVDEVTNTIYSGTWANSPRTAAAYGENLYRSGFTNRAIEVLSEGIRRHPRDSQLHVDRAVVLFRTGRVSEALPDAEEGVRFAPESPTAAETLRTVLQSRGESEEVIQSRMRELRGK
jgi:Flp pilus assembly protein TadD